MGELSHYLPKPLLPLFEKTLLDFQVFHLRKLGVERIFLNTHHLAEQIAAYGKSFEEIQIVHEPELLGSGGVFHNLKRAGLQGPILSLNADNIILGEGIKAMGEQGEKTHWLLAQRVPLLSPYNRLVWDERQFLTEVSPPSREHHYTYSGVGIINLDILGPQEGASSFFSSVCRPGSQEVRVYVDDALEFWDFGTLEDYYQNARALARKLFDDEDSLWKKTFGYWGVDPSNWSKGLKSYRSAYSDALVFGAGKHRGESGALTIQLAEELWAVIGKNSLKLER